MRGTCERLPFHLDPCSNLAERHPAANALHIACDKPQDKYRPSCDKAKRRRAVLQKQSRTYHSVPLANHLSGPECRTQGGGKASEPCVGCM